MDIRPGSTSRTSGPAVTRIVMIGAGYTSYGTWRMLKRKLRKHLADGRVSVTVVSARNYHYFHGFIGEMISGVVAVGAGMSAARVIFAGARFITGTVTRVDTDAGRVHVASTVTEGGPPDEAGDDLVLEYDHLVVGTGARYRRDVVEGLGEFGWALRDVGVVQGFRNHLINCFERADVSRCADQARRALTFVIAGGGFAGVEIAAALGELIAEMRKHYPVLERIPPRVVLVHSGSRILPEIAEAPRLVAYAERQLARHGVELLLEARVARVERTAVTLSTGAALDTDTVLCTIGNEVVPLPGLERLPLDAGNRLRTDACLQAGRTGTGSIWAGGDCASVPRFGRGTPCPANALWATRHGERIGRNLARVVSGKAPEPFTYRGLGLAASMGVGKGMGMLFGVPLLGWIGWVARLLVFLTFMPSRRQALGALLDHARLPFCGRGLVPLDTSGRGGAAKPVHQHQLASERVGGAGSVRPGSGPWRPPPGSAVRAPAPAVPTAA